MRAGGVERMNKKKLIPLFIVHGLVLLGFFLSGMIAVETGSRFWIITSYFVITTAFFTGTKLATKLSYKEPIKTRPEHFKGPTA